jgi:hypothetical protein
LLSPLPVLLLSFRSEAEKSAVAVAVACPFVCHFAAKRRNLLLLSPLPFWCHPEGIRPRQPTRKHHKKNLTSIIPECP